MNFIEELRESGACSDGVEWAEKYETAQEAWDACTRGDHMLWVLGKLAGPPESESRKKLTLATCECAREALPYVKKGEKRPLEAIETAEAHARGEGPSLEDVRNAAYATDAAADAAYYAADAAYSAALAAADAAYYAADAAYSAALVAYSAASAADGAAYAKTLSTCADIVRKHYPIAPAKTNRKSKENKS